jgi:hypothetical protein
MPGYNSPLKQIPPPKTIHAYIGQLLRELALCRRLMRLSQTAREEQYGEADFGEGGQPCQLSR